jgi:hypothetical protein
VRWLVTFGSFDSTAGVVLEVQWTRGHLHAAERARFEPRLDRSVAGKGLTGACWHPEGLVACSFNTVELLDPSGRFSTLLIRDDFNDLHDVALHGEHLWIANTGLDRLDTFDQEGQRIATRQLSPLPGALESDVGDPYFVDSGSELPTHRRRLIDRVHPNSLHSGSDALLLTRLLDRSVCLAERPTVPVARLDGCPHDAVLVDGVLWATTTDGRVHRLPRPQDETEGSTIDVFAASGWTGWCRGLHVGPDLLAVGLTRVDHMPRTRWCDRPLEETVTAFVLLDRATGACLDRLELLPLGPRSKLFSIVPLEGRTGW